MEITIRVHTGEKKKKMSQGKAYKQYLGNTENQAELIDRFCCNHKSGNNRLYF